MWIVANLDSTSLIVAGVAVLLCILYTAGSKRRRRGRAAAQGERKQGIVYLRQFGRATFAPNPSPYCLKLEAFLRMCHIPYEIPKGFAMSAKGKMPWIEYNGQEVADSSFCVEFLDRELKIGLDAKLSDVEKAQALTIKLLCEEHLYWPIVYGRWIDTPLTTLFRLYNFRIGFPLNHIYGWRAKKTMKAYLHGQGMGRHSREEIYEMGCRDIRAIAAMLGTKKYMMGDAITSVDATVFGFMASVVFDPVNGPLCQEAKKQANIVQYVNRFKEQFFADWDKLIAGPPRNT